MTAGEVAVFATEGHPYGAAGALVALVAVANQADLGRGVDDAVGAGRLDAVHGAGQRGGGPQQAAERAGEDLGTFMPCLRCLPE